LKEKRTHPR